MSADYIEVAYSRNTAIFARISVVSSALGLGLLLLLHFIQPNLSPLSGFISQYAVGKFGILMNVVFLSFAISLACFAMSYRSLSPSRLLRTGVVLACISAIGMLLGALFNTDSADIMRASPTTTGMLHNIGGQLNLTPFVALLVTFGVRHVDAVKPLWRRMLTISVVVLSFTLGFVITVAWSEGDFGPGSITALFGRLMLVSYFIWQYVALKCLLKNET